MTTLQAVLHISQPHALLCVNSGQTSDSPFPALVHPELAGEGVVWCVRLMVAARSGLVSSPDPTPKRRKGSGDIGADSWFCKLSSHVIIYIGLYWSTCHWCARPRKGRVGAKPGLWTLDWTHGLDCGLRFGLDFGLMRWAMTTISNNKLCCVRVGGR